MPAECGTLPGAVPVLARAIRPARCCRSTPAARARLADRYDFVIASDECYARDLPRRSARRRRGCCRPPRQRPRRLSSAAWCSTSLSKRSSVPGLRSGFVAGDAALIQRFLLYRTYHGCAMPLPTQHASIAAWNDDAHVAENRALYREKFARVLPMLAPVLDVDAAGRRLLPVARRARATTRRSRANCSRAQQCHRPARQLPGARQRTAGNPGRGRVRISLVPTVDECVDAAQRIARFAEHASPTTVTTDLTEHLAATIDAAFERRAEFTPRRRRRRQCAMPSRSASSCSIRGQARVAEKKRRPVDASTSGSRRPCCCTSARTTTR